ncbi:MAG: hypothetical protein V3T33_06930 [Myxococcota bacterium]
MSRRPARRARRFRDTRASLFGRAAQAAQSGWRVIAPGFVAALVAALLLVALRIDVIRMRYGLAEAVSSERRLLEEKNELTVAMRRLRHPSRLAEHARRLGFVRPEHVIFLSTDDTYPTDERLLAASPAADASKRETWPVLAVPPASAKGAGVAEIAELEGEERP